jgi:diphosphomevalonate decarboxylase
MTTYAPSSTSFTATTPSNIALLKYWGKRDLSLQWPANDSISMTLNACKTVTTARRSLNNLDSFTMDGLTINSNCHKDHKIFRQLDRIRSSLNVHGFVELTSENSFPSSCGIASSASGFSALTLASAAALLGTANWEELDTLGANRRVLAHLSRMGSGSAGRSIYGGYVKWTAGASAEQQEIDQLWTDEHWRLSDIIVVISSEAKAISSSDAHKAAWGSPLFGPRLSGVAEKAKILEDALARKDLELLGHEIETEALDMHAICMTGTPPITYLTEKTSAFLSWLRSHRQRGMIHAWATIDAGPNPHLICRPQDAAGVCKAIQQEWPDLHCIMDETGPGPSLISTQRSVKNV